MKEITTYRETLSDKESYHKAEMQHANEIGDAGKFRYHFHMLIKYTGKIRKYDREHNWGLVV